ncbi:MAG: hypothetical protein HPY67_00525 [Syntrophaceae bacterium]|nr:hypothetical protein [Syntrophaceae bacterium]
MAVPRQDAVRLRRAASLARLDASRYAEGGKPDSLTGLWASMGRRGLLGLSVPPEFGGEGARYVEMRAAMDAFAHEGGRPGLALSWAVHLIVAKTLIAGCGTGRQRREILPAMASGRKTIAIALSEPGAGSDPKQIRTRAVKSGNRYVLDGEKTWLTNGPLADMFLAFAVTDRRAERKGFTAFLVPKETPGLTIAALPPLGFLEPALHCAVRLERCAVPADAVIGREGRAWEDLSKPFRAAEDVLIAGGAVLGGLDRLLRQRIGEWPNRPGDDTAAAERVGEAASLLAAARLVAVEAALSLDAGEGGDAVGRRLVSLQRLVGYAREAVRGASEALGCGRRRGTSTFGEDLDKLIALGDPALRARRRKWGYALLSGKEKP